MTLTIFEKNVYYVYDIDRYLERTGQMKRYDIPGFAERLRALREARGLSLGELGKHLQTSRQAIHAYESGLSQPTLALAIKLADALDISLDELVGRTPRNGHREPPPAPRRRQGAARAAS